jgi:hypothetical protein
MVGVFDDIAGQRVDNGRIVLRRAFRDLEQKVPESMARLIRKLRHPDARWIRIPAGLLLTLGGIFSILPVLGLWMLPLGLLLIAQDVPFLREPVGRFTIWGTRKWVACREWVRRRRERRPA